MSGVYWGLTAMFLMNKQDMMEKDEILEFVQSCQHDNGGFGASQNHDSHLLYTLSAIQVFTEQPKHNACARSSLCVHKLSSCRVPVLESCKMDKVLCG